MKKFFNTIEEILNTIIFKDLEIKEHQKEKIEELIKKYEKKTFYNIKKTLRDFVIYDVDGSWFERIEKIKNFFNRDGFSLESLKCRYGDVVGAEKFKEQNKKVTLTLEILIDKYGKKDGEKKWSEICENRKSVGLNLMIKRYGEEEGKKKWENYLEKWKKGIEKAKERGWKKNGNLEYYIAKYGEEEGKEVYKKNIEKRNFKRTKAYYIEQYGQEEGEIRWRNYCKSMNKTSLESFIGRYGKEEGEKRYSIYQEKLSYASKVEYYIDKYGKEEGEKIFKTVSYNRIQGFFDLKKNKYSKISQDLFWNILKESNDEEILTKSKFAEFNGEEKIFFTENFSEKCFFVDFKFENKIIEFYGNYFHANPKIYSPSDKIKFIKSKEILAGEIWSTDKKRVEYLEKMKYDVLIIWEEDYKKNKKEIIEKCINFLKKI